MGELANIELRRKQIRRTRVLQRLAAINPAAFTEISLLHELKVNDADLNISPEILRIDLRYLKGHRLCDIEISSNTWTAIITSHGVDFLDGLVELKGLHRPQDLGS
jgi:hypothetical protein